MPSVPKITIIGAGPIGLTISRIPSHHANTSTVFDSDPSLTYRSQGGTRATDKDGTLKMDYRGVDTGCPEIDRARLQRVLLESVPNNYDSLGTQGVHLTSRFTKTWTKRLDKPGLRPASSVFTLTY
ncbi:hypothetical protein GTA08_BOTSDO06424 [Botryosphaeria dothidea]|uniref:Uncharacterized protein n=1 Tax=Botryosphaeria dothidea TaxID=55169 RepID=A0A8H4IPP3_9PEZI|nr:hypothetical protein GTA08_BOTSDO06424 [Botryosphaeria dothidea]